jgi:GPH family glycoside/pentoside/hexuronide:cation symporter
MVKNPVAENVEKLPRGYTLAWATRGLSLAVNVLFMMQVTYYATDFAGLGVALVGTLLFVAGLTDGVTDLVVGFIINKTNTRWGKARPYEIMIIPLWICTILLFSTPNMGTVGKAAYIFVLYVLINSVCATFLNATDSIYMVRSLTNEQNRAKVLAINGVIIMLCAAGISILLPQLMANWAPQPGGWTKIGMVIGLPLLVIGMGRFFFIKETVVDAQTEEDSRNMSLKECLIVLIKNKYAFILAGCVFFCYMFQYITSAAATYYFRYIIGDVGSMSLVGMSGLLAPFVLLLFPISLRKIGAMNFIRIGLVASIAGSVIKSFAGTNLAMLTVGGFLASVGITPLSMMINLFLIQCMDYSEWKSGKRIDGYIPGLTKFSDKLGSGIAFGGLGLLMNATGYNAALETQSKTAIAAISGLYTWIPGLVSIVMLLLINLYDLDKKMPQIKQEIAERKERNKT